MLSKNKAEIDFKDRMEANRLIKDPDLRNHNLTARIPKFRTERKGIIKGIDEDLTDEEVLKCIVSPMEVLHVRRLKKRNRDPNRTDEDQKWIPSQSMVLTFAGQSLPPEVSIYKVIVEVAPFMSLPIYCYNCYKPGHTSKVCRSEAKCIMCGSLKHEGRCLIDTPRCANCREDHIPTNRICPIYKKEKEVRRLMAFENIAMEDARKIVYGLKKSFQPKIENFPAIRRNIQPTFSSIVKNSIDKNLETEEKSADRKIEARTKDTDKDKDIIPVNSKIPIINASPSKINQGRLKTYGKSTVTVNKNNSGGNVTKNKIELYAE